MNDIIIIVPTLNEKENIKILFNKLTATKIRFDLLFVDDNSIDGSQEEIKELIKENQNVEALKGIGAIELALPGLEKSVDSINGRLTHLTNKIAASSADAELAEMQKLAGLAQKTIEVFESLGLSGCHIEDQIDEKRCGHLDNKEIIPTNEMVKKIKTSLNSRKDKNFLIIVRTDANTVEGLKKTIDRVKAYENAGADIIFPEAMKDEKEFEEIRKNTKVPLLANMTEFGKSKLLTANILENLGYNVVIYPVTTQRLAMKSVEDGLKVIFGDGHQNNIIDKMQTRKRLYELVEYEKYNTPDKKITDFKTDGHE